jgi:hypothetical protein
VAGSFQHSCGSGILRFLTPPAPSVANVLLASRSGDSAESLTYPTIGAEDLLADLSGRHSDRPLQIDGG